MVRRAGTRISRRRRRTTLIDTHCHLVPGVDDGPADQAEAVALARSLVADGVSEVVCTPHYSAHFPYELETAVERLDSLNLALIADDVPLTTILAAEVHPTLAVSAPLPELQRRSIGGRFVVVEALPDSPAPLFASASTRLAEAGLVPVFAHPERTRAVQRHPALLDPFRQNGALLQIVAPSLLGRWGDDVRATAWRLVDTGRADLVGSDAHGMRRRRVHLREAMDLIHVRLGPEVVSRLTEETPRRLLAGATVPQQPGG
jgi:protein-tyrosine phosphatase